MNFSKRLFFALAFVGFALVNFSGFSARQSKDFILTHHDLSLTSQNPSAWSLKFNSQDWNLKVMPYKNAVFAHDVVRFTDAKAVINASFFDPQNKPLGLLKEQGVNLNPYKSISWWSILCINNDNHKIFITRDKMQASQCSSAIQTGPRLISNYKVIDGLKDDYSRKSAVCIIDSNQVVLFASESPLSATQLAQFLKSEFKCQEALNLDGGSSTQMSIRNESGVKNLVSGFSSVPVFLGLFSND